MAVIKSEKNAWMEGLRISEIAERLGKEPVELVMDLMLEEQDQVQVNQHVLNHDDVEFLLRQEESMLGSDGSAITPRDPGLGKPHPRAYGAFARFLGCGCGTIVFCPWSRRFIKLPENPLLSCASGSGTD